MFYMTLLRKKCVGLLQSSHHCRRTVEAESPAEAMTLRQGEKGTLHANRLICQPNYIVKRLFRPKRPFFILSLIFLNMHPEYVTEYNPLFLHTLFSLQSLPRKYLHNTAFEI